MNAALRTCLPAFLLAVAPTLFAADDASKLTSEQMEEFLKAAKIVKIKELSTGVTNSRRASLPTERSSTTPTSRASTKPKPCSRGTAEPR